MKQYTASDVAKELGVDAKTLRRLLRNSPDWTAPGSGGSWTFTTSDLPKLRSLVDGHNSKPKGSPNTLIKDAPGLPYSVVKSRAPEDIARVKRFSEARVDRLEAALKAAGLHISQMRERESWVPATI